MGKITLNGKDISHPFVAFTSGPHANKEVIKITVGGKDLTLTPPRPSWADDILYVTGDDVYRGNTKIFSNTIRDYDPDSIVVDKDNNWYTSVYNKLYKNGSELYSDTGTITSPVIDKDGNVYYGTYYSASDGVYKNGSKIYSASHPVTQVRIGINGDVYWLENVGNIHKNDSLVRTLSGTNNIAVDKDDNIYSANHDGKVYKNGSVIHTGSPDLGAWGIAVDKNGSVFWQSNGKIYKNDTQVNTSDVVYSSKNLAIDGDGRWVDGGGFNYYLRDDHKTNTVGTVSFLAPAWEYGARTGNW